ncbi:hypothetical protein HMPREF9965_0338 [Streptococcus mitis bv. 2 str. SK95]|jgi:hypothetical protein|uniref:Uncharacterized protein n=2 Tax=Streptococcus oralis subsp. dentisani TaxID=1458253 RepID=A0A1X1JCV1_STROR|nr:hypothetical protein HMPREF9965_0338 [Streptococcus mitis bv. 2 str. SK95]ORO84572.1 hypothetical protein B7705_02670 [Streptococcus oralis subsp. dentisani]
MFLKKEVILLGIFLSLRIIFTIIQILIDYKILSGKYSVNFMEISEVFTYPILISIIYIAVKYNTKE